MGESIKSFLEKTEKRKRIFEISQKFLFYLIIFLTCIFLLSWLDYLLFLSFSLRQILNYFILAGLAFVLFDIIYSFFKKINLEKTSIFIQEKIPSLHDDLINAFQLNEYQAEIINSVQDTDPGHSQRPYFSLAMIEKFGEIVTDKINLLSLKNIISFKKLKNSVLVVILMLCINLFSSLFFPFLKNSYLRILLPHQLASLEEIALIIPGDISIPKGEKLKIGVQLPEGRPLPKIRYQFPSAGSWQKKPMETETGRNFKTEFTTTEDFSYQILWKDFYSKTYRVNLIKYPEIGDLQFYLYCPAYTGLPVQFLEKSDGNIEVISGTRVKILAQASKPLKEGKIIFSNNQIYPLKIVDKTKIEGEFPVTEEIIYSMQVKDEQGYFNMSYSSYTISIVKDKFPEIELLSPQEDLVVSEKSKITLVYQVKDDFGIDKVNILYKIYPEEKFRKQEIEKFPSGIQEKISEWIWNLDYLNLTAGKTIEYYLEVIDNNTITGPGKGISAAYKIEIFSYEKEHMQIEKDLADFREKLLKLLAQQIEAKQKNEKLAAALPEEKNSIWNQLGIEQEKIRKDAGDINQNLTNIIRRMKEDPLSEDKIVYEHQQISENLKYLKENPMTTVLNDIKQQDSPMTGKKQEEIIAALEKMVLLSEDVLEYQKTYDLLSSSQDLNETGADLLKQLENMKSLSSLDPEKQKELQKLMEKIANLLNKLQETLAKTPRDLPEEFINQAGVKDINFQKDQDLWSKLAEAIQKGDLQSALEYAKALASELNQMLSTFQTASQDTFYPEMESLTDNLDKKMQELEEIIKKQQEILEKTNALDQKRINALLSKQKEILKELIEKQKKVIEETKEFKMWLIVNYSNDLSNIMWLVDAALYKMEKVYDEFTRKEIINSKSMLNEIIQDIKNWTVPMDNNYKIFTTELDKQAKIKEETEKKQEKMPPEWEDQNKILTKKKENSETAKNTSLKIQKEEQEILDMLTKTADQMSDSLFTPGQQDELKNLASSQGDLEKQIEQLIQKLKELSRSTAGFSPEFMDKLNSGKNSMAEAENFLYNKSSGKAMEKELEALDSLGQGKKGMQEMKEGLNGMKKKMGESVGQRPGGIKGVRTGFVKLPGANDFIPAKELRQEIIKSMKEKYPKIYDTLIKEYYKRLTE